MALVGPGAVVLEGNRALRVLLGRSTGELAGRPLTGLLHPSSLDEQVDCTVALLAEGEAMPAQEFALLGAQGRRVEARVRVTPLREGPGHLLLHVEDVTDHQQAERALREVEGRHRVFFENAQEGMALLGAEGRFIQVNPALCALLGAEESDLLGHPVDRFLEFEDGLAVRTLFRDEGAFDALIAGTDNLRVRGRATPLRDARGRLVSWALHLERGARTASRPPAPSEARELDLVGRLAGGVAHDFNNLLMVVMHGAECLARRVGEHDARAGKAVQSVREATGRAAALTRKLQVFARRQPLALDELELAEVMGDLRGTLRKAVGPDLRFEVRVAPWLGRVRLARAHLEQALVHLLENAAAASPAGGRVVIEVLPWGGFREGERSFVALAVRDEGHGMTPEVLAQVFEPFFSTKPTHGTAGLGLPIVRGIAEEAGGRVWIESTPGHGSTAFLVLPAIAGPRLLPGRFTEQLPRGNGEAVLVVDDESSICEVTVEILAEHGYTVCAAQSPEDALRHCAEEVSYDVLVTDVIMPGMTGHELAASLVARHPGLRVLFMSGHVGDRLPPRDIVDRGVAFLPKPFTGPELLCAVRAVLGTRQG